MSTLTPIELLHETQRTKTYLADAAHLNKQVILKVLKKESTNPKTKAQFFSEYNFLHDTDLPGVRRALEKIVYQGEHALLLEYIPAKSLREVISESQTTLIQKFKISNKIADTLSQIHLSGIIHKDINPNNILYKEDTGEVYVIDFNISSRVDIKTKHLGNPEQLEGTLEYISPEQTGRMNRILDYRSDLYSLGVLMYELFTDMIPFSSDDAMELVHKHIATEPTPPHLINTELPEVVSDIIIKLLSKNTEDRYQSATGLAHDLGKAISLCKDNQIEPFPIGQKDYSNRFQIPEKLYGRSKETELLLTSFDNAAAGGKELLLIGGHSGTGKSALVSEVHKPIAGKNGLFISGKFDQFQRNTPYFAISQAISAFCTILLSQNKSTLGCWRDKLLNALGKNGKILTDMVPELEQIIGEQPEIQQLGSTESQARLNYVFKNFISAIASQEHPLVIFIDDVQWADSASLNLIRVILTDFGIGHIFVILSYRDNEVSSSHPLHNMLNNLSHAALRQTKTILKNLTKDDIAEFVADTFHKSPKEVAEVAHLINEKTGGNPFFVKEFLLSLHREELITFRTETNFWEWDIKNIKAKGLTDNVVSLLSEKAALLPEKTRRILQLGAFEGNTFSLGHILQLTGESPKDISGMLLNVIQMGIIAPAGDNYMLLDENEYNEKVFFHFVHDRLQQVFYNIFGDDNKSQTHLDIARLLFAESDEKEREELSFDLANHFNKAISLLSDKEEKNHVARINLIAARKARLSSAYSAALQYANAGLELLDKNCWKNNHEIVFHLHLEKAENEHLCGNHEAAESYFEVTIANAANNAESALACEKKVHFYADIGKYREAFATGRDVLRKKFNIKLPQNPPKPALIFNMLRTKFAARGMDVRDIANLPEATEEDARLAIKLIGGILKSAYQIKPELAVANAMVLVNLCLKKGNTIDSAVGYLVFGGIFLGAILGIRKTGYDFGMLARDIVEKYNSQTQKSEVTFVFGYFANSWLKPMRDAEELFQKAYEYGLETGDIFHTGTSCCAMLQHNLMGGLYLDEISDKAETYYALLEQIGANSELKGTVQAIHQAVKSLQGLTESPGSFNDDGFSEEEYEQAADKYVSQHFAHYYFLNKMMVHYHLKQYNDALIYCEKSEKCMGASAGMLHSTEHLFYKALVHSALISTGEGKKSVLKSVYKKFKKWAAENPDNFESRKNILKGELHKINNEPWHAAKAFSDAKKRSVKDGYDYLQTIANVLLAQLHSAAGQESESQSFLKEAHYQYLNWGATLAADATVPDTVAQQTGSINKDSLTSTGYNSSGSSSSESVDINTITKLSQTLSGEMMLSSLLNKVMKLVIENAGAQHGYLLLKDKKHGWIVQAGSSVTDNEAKVYTDKPLSELLPEGSEPSISGSIVNYVIHSGSHVILDDAVHDNQFYSDEYIKSHKPKSILCAPLIYKGEMTGILYLENNLATNVFTLARLQLINHLSTQIAISVQNAMLYSNLQQEMKERKRSEKERIKIAAENERRSFELEHMRELQLSMLPQNPPDCKKYDFATHMRTATEVGGDYYDFLIDDDNELTVVIGDATGHGMGAGVLVTITKSVLHSIKADNPAAMLDKLSRIIRKVQSGQYKMALKVLTLNGDSFKFSSAAMPPVYIYHSKTNTVSEIMHPGLLLGTMAKISYSTFDGTLESGDAMLLLSDGLPEYENHKGVQLGYEPVKECLQKYGNKSASEIMDKLIELGDDWAKGLPNGDDITLMVIKKK